MRPERPRTRRKFTDVSAEMSYLYDKLLYWLYKRQDARRARLFADRLEEVLVKVKPEPESVFTEECWSLVHEAKGDLAKAIKHRKNEIRRIRRLHEMSQNTSSADFVFRNYSHADLSDRLDLLAVLYHDSGQLDRAIETLEESKQLCAEYGVTFDGADVLREYRGEKDDSEGISSSQRGTRSTCTP